MGHHQPISLFHWPAMFLDGSTGIQSPFRKGNIICRLSSTYVQMINQELNTETYAFAKYGVQLGNGSNSRVII